MSNGPLVWLPRPVISVTTAHSLLCARATSPRLTGNSPEAPQVRRREMTNTPNAAKVTTRLVKVYRITLSLATLRGTEPRRPTARVASRVAYYSTKQPSPFSTGYSGGQPPPPGMGGTGPSSGPPDVKSGVVLYWYSNVVSSVTSSVVVSNWVVYSVVSY